MKISKTLAIGTGIIAVLALSGCNNFFHDLIPSDDNYIVTFEFDGQMGRAEINSNTIIARAEKGTDLHAVVPRVSVSEKAAVLPATLDYIQAAFPGINLLKAAMDIYTTGDISGLVTGLIETTPNFQVPKPDLPIDFSGPVTFLVISARGNVREYTVTIIADQGEPELLSFRFSKYDNPELTLDATGQLSERNQSITTQAVYPVEMDYLSYMLIPTFDILGDRLEVEGVEITSGETPIQFDTMLGTQNKQVTVWRDGANTDYTLAVTFSEDPETIRSIVDFRFNKADNPDIAVNAVASVFNTSNTGTIAVQVYYSGVKPDILTARFITPGTVNVAGITQTGGKSTQVFSAPLEYRVVSRNGQYARLYTVKVEFIKLSFGDPRIINFMFSQNLNTELTQDSTAEISDGRIVIDAWYGGLSAPETLIPVFSAEGVVTVSNSVQISGSSPQNFTRQVKYTVTNPELPELQRDYWVQCRVVQDADSRAIISAFGIYREENPGLGLADDLSAKIDQSTGKISILAPLGSGVKGTLVFPRFEAAGQVSTNGIVQSSGASPQIFAAPLTYTVTSANGRNSRNYTVEVFELDTPIFVNCNASGMGDGTSWENAFLNLQTACEAAALFPDWRQKEVWIAAGTYRPGETADNYFIVAPNTSYIGGFAGYEGSKSQRDIAANETIISGDLGGGRYSYHLFAPGFDASDNPLVTEGDLSFENLTFCDAKAVIEAPGDGTGDIVRRTCGAAILVQLDEYARISVRGCTFRNLTVIGSGRLILLTSGVNTGKYSWTRSTSGIALNVMGGITIVSDTAFYSCNSIPPANAELVSGSDSGAVYIKSIGINIQNIRMEDNSGGLSLTSNRKTTIDGLNLRNNGYSLINVSAAELIISGIRAYNNGNSNISSSSGFTLRDSIFESCGAVGLGSSRGTLYVINTVIRDCILPNSFATYDNFYDNAISILFQADAALYVNIASSSNAVDAIIIDQLTIDGAPYNGLKINAAYGLPFIQIRNSTIKNCPGSSAYNAGIFVGSYSSYSPPNSGLEIINTNLENLTSAASPIAILFYPEPSYPPLLRFKSDNIYNGSPLSENVIRDMVLSETIFLPWAADWVNQGWNWGYFWGMIP